MDLTRDDLPDSIQRLRDLKIELLEAEGQSESTCPVPIDETFAHLTKQCSDGACASEKSFSEYNLRFVRTAELNQTIYWIWFFDDEDGAESFVLVGSGEKKVLEYDETLGMSAEQIIVAYHFDIE